MRSLTKGKVRVTKYRCLQIQPSGYTIIVYLIFHIYKSSVAAEQIRLPACNRIIKCNVFSLHQGQQKHVKIRLHIIFAHRGVEEQFRQLRMIAPPPPPPGNEASWVHRHRHCGCTYTQKRYWTWCMVVVYYYWNVWSENKVDIFVVCYTKTSYAH